VNTVSPVFQTQLGYQFLKITDSRPAGVVSLADARSIIAPKLKDMKMQQQSQDYAKKLLDNSGVTYHLKLVDPPAQMDAQGAPGGPGPGGQGGPEPGAPSAPPTEPDTTSNQAPPPESEPAPSTNTPPPQ
jgi:hypothetical protein